MTSPAPTVTICPPGYARGYNSNPFYEADDEDPLKRELMYAICVPFKFERLEEEVMQSELDFPWPYKGLSPNEKVHWAVKNRAAGKYKTACKLLAVQMTAPPIVDGFMRFNVTFHPPGNHRRDWDNLVASAKYLFDGLALAWGVDDSIFRPECTLGEPVKFGAVRVSV